MNYLPIIGLGIVTIALALLSWHFFQQAQNLKARYSHIADVEAEVKARRSRSDSEVAAAQAKLEQTKLEQQKFEFENERRRNQLNKEYEEGLAKYKELKKEVSLLEENLEDISFGLYKPHFNFQTSEEYKKALQDLRNRERKMVRDGFAAVCPVK